MAERYKRYLTSGVTTETLVYTAPDDGVVGNLGPANSVIIGLLVASTSASSGELTVELVDHASAGGGAPKTVRLAHTIPLPASTSVDLIPGKLVVQSGDNSAATPALTGDKINVTSTQSCDITISVVERV
tara:strand:- start:572 stop:961 length:390 start_codon:yes stop_codon:yes gene_type:complete